MTYPERPLRFLKVRTTGSALARTQFHELWELISDQSSRLNTSYYTGNSLKKADTRPAEWMRTWSAEVMHHGIALLWKRRQLPLLTWRVSLAFSTCLTRLANNGNTLVKTTHDGYVCCMINCSLFVHSWSRWALFWEVTPFECGCEANPNEVQCWNAMLNTPFITAILAQNSYKQVFPIESLQKTWSSFAKWKINPKQTYICYFTCTFWQLSFNVTIIHAYLQINDDSCYLELNNDGPGRLHSASLPHSQQWRPALH